MPTNTTNSIQLSAISNLDSRNLDISNISSDASFVNVVNNLSIEVSYTDTQTNKIFSQKLALTDLFSAISSYVSHERSQTENTYLKVKNEERTWIPNSRVTIQPASGKSFVVKSNNNSSLISIDNTSITLSSGSKITFKSAQLSSYATDKNVVRADKTLILNATSTELDDNASVQPCVRIHAGNATTNDAPIEFKGNKNAGSNDTIAHFDVKIGNRPVRNNQGEVGCIALSAKWA